MPTSSYLPKDDSGKADLPDYVNATLPKYAALLEISPKDMASHQANVAGFRYALNLVNKAQSYSQKNLLGLLPKLPSGNLFLSSSSMPCLGNRDLEISQICRLVLKLEFGY